MKRKLTLVFIAISFLLLGILYFQAQFIYASYKLNRSTYMNTVSASFSKALELTWREYQKTLEKSLAHRLETDKYSATVKAGNKDLAIVLTPKNHGNLMSSHIYYFERASIEIEAEENNIPEYKFEEIKKHAQDVIFGLSSYQNTFAECATIKNERPLVLSPLQITSDSIKLANYFKKTLLASPNNIQPEFELKFVTNEGLSNLAGTGANFKPDILIMGNVYNYHSLVYYGIGKLDLYVGALVPIPAIKFIKNIIGLLIISTLLMIGTVLSYFYLLRIILNQRRLAEIKDDFINNMTHELKTPIATVSAAIESMQSFNALQDADKTKRYLETSRKELLKLNTLVTKVLDMAGYEKNEIELLMSDVDVDELIHNIIAVERLHLSKNVHFDFKNKSNIKTIKADPVHFRNALENLVDNAIKYSGDPVTVLITCYKIDEFIYFAVSDNGIGIPAADLKRVFDKFHRVTTGNVHNVKGTGLGLSYVKYVVEAHGGRVSVKSEQVRGSEFIISIPIA